MLKETSKLVYPGKIKFYQVDIRDFDKMNKIFKIYNDANIVYHFAAQVAVTTSVLNPREDFEINVLGTINVLETMRLNKSSSLLIFSSTNKVYGGMENIKIVEKGNRVSHEGNKVSCNSRYQYVDYHDGIDETFPLDFHSPYGCSKGAAEQYVRDYHRIYGLNTEVFRQSCIYGENQFGIEEQGWVAYFTIASILNFPITFMVMGNRSETFFILMT